MFNSNYFSKLISLSCLFLIFTISLVHAQDDGLLNSSFESGISSWNASGQVTVITGENTTTKGTNETVEVKVSPLHGVNLVRLGSVKDISENMDAGKNSVSQTFTPNSDVIVVGFSLYSWEHRSGRDTFTIDVKQPSNPNKITITNRDSGSPLSVNGQTCSVLPCDLDIYSGSRGDFVNTGWQYVVISGLVPSDGTDQSNVSVTYSLNGLNDSGHHSWAYIDSWNTNPVANFTVTRENTIEGNVSKFTDISTDVDVNDAVTNRIWEITYNSINGTKTETKNYSKQISVIASNEGTVTAQLTVHDRFGGSDTVSSGQIRGESTVPFINYSNSEIFVNNLDTYNVVAGSKGNIITARYAKPGWDDAVTPSWNINTGDGSLGEENHIKYPVPMMLKGVVSVEFDAPDIAGTSSIQLILSSGNVSTDPKIITVNVLSSDDFLISQSDDGNDVPVSADTILSGSVDVAHLNKQGDIDYYKIRDENGNKFPIGSEVFVRLRNVSTDHDLFVVMKDIPLPSGMVEDLSTALQEDERLGTFFQQGRLGTFFQQGRLGTFFQQGRLGTFFQQGRLGTFFQQGRLGTFFQQGRLGTFFQQGRLGTFFQQGRLGTFFQQGRLGTFFQQGRLDGENYERLNSIGAVVFGNPGPNGYTWDRAAEESILHSMWLRDSELDPFSDASMFNYKQLPLSEAIFLPLQGTSVGQKDIDISETALNKVVGNGYQVLSFSSNDGYDDEVIMLRVSSNDEIYLAIASDGEFGTPYSLQVEHSIPANLEHMTDGACVGTKLVESGTAASSGLMATDVGSFGDSVMYVVNPQRMIAKFGQDRWDATEAKLKKLAQLANGKILVITESAIYDNMDLNPCNVETANNVSTLVRAIINSNRGVTKNIVLVGDDQIIPFYRALDPTDFIERDYVAQTSISVSSPLYSALFNSRILTDKIYASDYSIEDMPNKLLIPLWGVSRLVESPEDIIASIDAHIDNAYNIEINTAMVSAYDIVLDSGKEIATTLSTALTEDNVTEIPFNFDLTDPWYASNIKCYMLGDIITNPACTAKDLVSLNGHFTHDTLVTQAAHEMGIDDYLTAKNIEKLANGNISGNYIYTPGCHAGLNVPAPSIISLDVDDLRHNYYRDFPASYLNNGATYLAGTGYGIAGVNTSAYSEKLMSIQTKSILQGGSVGMAAANADATYLMIAINDGLNAYDIKAMYQSTLYGFSDAKLPPSPAPVIVNNETCSSDGNSQEFSLTVIDGNQSSVLDTVTMKKVCTNSGDYYEIDGNTVSTVNRPVQPVSDFSFASTSGEIHGVYLEEANFIDEPINPVFLTPTTDNTSGTSEIEFCQDGRYWPSKVVDYSDSGIDTFLKFVSGQFICTDNNENSGIQRLYTNAVVKVLRSTSTEYIAPVVNSVEPQINALGNVAYYVDATDESGIQQIVLNIYQGNSVKTIKSELLTGDGPYRLVLNAEDSFLALNNNTTISVIDGSNNITIASSKGRGMKQIVVDIEDSNLISTISPKQLTATIVDFDLRKTVAKSMSFVWEFGDGRYETGSIFNGDGVNINLNLTENPDGSATLSTTHQYVLDADVSVKFKVTDSSGGIGSDEMMLRSCSDAKDFTLADGDLVQCDVTSTGTKINIMVKVADGGLISPDFQYRLYLDYTNDGANDLKFTYDNNSIGKTNKVDNLTATVNGSILTISFDLAKTGWTPELPLNWYMETQSGVQKGKAIGSADVMPDSGYFSY